ncbi:cobalamin-independent methionine synthase II family protein [Actinomycetospora sp. TBRC 11914]|uniref:cobalamin-independent methionine synthase II family protein n=1 Tax=Actinomycetospora sp. TBRC 11914 TaxID=2729387 RepID=UPI00145DE84D|nr:cobalamin-independent methionine synthase II family protein [Actinomycetospora sp. TBRC 11914]NMO93587.1 cobalamin-independent methionine synthase II family protein [Actinomycetospora sp. TBRC 11914]
MTTVRTTHVGSLPRPESLVRLMYAHQEGGGDPAELEAAVTDAVHDVVAMQHGAGIDVVSDGEMGKPGFVNYVRERLSGFGGQAAPWSIDDLEAAPELAVAQYAGHIMPPNCEGEVAYVGQAGVARDVETLRLALDKTGHDAAFLPAASPGCIATCSPNLHYPDYDSYLDALADAMAHEYRAIVDAGLVLQLDCPDIPMAGHTNFWCRDEVERRGLVGFAERHVAAIDRALEGIDPSRVRLHLCWGNYEGPHHLDAPLAELLPAVLAGRPRMISFEAANPRHEHEWEDVRRLAIPDDVVLVPGVVDTLNNIVEHPRLVAQRLRRYADVVGPERVIASTDCGFGTFVGFGRVGAQVAQMKLQAMAEGAALVG